MTDQGTMGEPAKHAELRIYEGGHGGHDERPPPPSDGSEGAAVFGSHIGLKEMLVRRIAGDWKYAGGQWYGWDGRRWRRDKLKTLWRIATEVCKAEGSFADTIDLARKIQSAPSVHAAANLAAADSEVAIEMVAFDADRWLFNTPDGIIDLRSGQIAPHNRAALMTKIAAAGPRGDCPVFFEYLVEATGGDEALQRYLKRVAGYCLTGSIEEHCILFCHGPGGSGKTTFLLLIQDLLGDYAVNSPMNAFTVATGERHPTEFAHFFGARVVAASEIEEGMRWDEGKLKAISGGDKITARYMRGDFFTFEPQFKLLLAGNHRPRMRSADDAMRRRMQVIPFRHKPAKVDKQLREKLGAELGGILRWAVEGEIERRHLGGLNPPKVVQDATDKYFRDENTIGRWLDERCAIEANAWSETRALHRDYVHWAHQVGEFVLSERLFQQKVELMPGIEPQQHSRTRRGGFRGVHLLFWTPELPGIEARSAPRRERSSDPAERWDRE